MRLLPAGLTYVAVSTVAALLLGENAGGLNRSISFVSLIAGATAGTAVFFLIPPTPVRSASRTDSSRGELGHSVQPRVVAEDDDPLIRYRSIWLCLVGSVFAIFVVRYFSSL